MATIIETYEANTRMMKQNNGMLQEVLRQLKLLSVQLGIFDGGDISDTREILTKQDDPSIMVNQVFDKLPTTNEELARDRGVDTANQAENATPTDKSKKVSLYNYDQTEVFPFIGVMNNANKEGNEGVEKGKALIIASAGYDDQLLVSRLMGQTSNLKDSNMIFGDNANPIQSNMVGTSNLNLTLREIWDSYLHLMGTVPIKEMMSIDLVKGAKVPVSAENAYSMRRMLGPPQVQLGLVTSFQIIVMVVELGTGDQGNRYHDSWIVMNFDPGGISIAKISNGDNLLVSKFISLPDFYFGLLRVELEFVKKSIRVHDSIMNQPQTSSSLANNLEETLVTSNGFSTSMHLNCKNLVYHDKEQLEFEFDSHKATADARNYDSPKFSKSELGKLYISDATTLGNDYVSCASIPGLSFKNREQSSSLSFVIDPNARNLPIFLQLHSNSMANDILAAALQSTEARDSAAFLTSLPILSRYNGSALSVKKPIVSMPQPSSYVPS